MNTTAASVITLPSTRTRQLALAITGSLFIAASAQVSIPLWPIPLTMQTFAVLLVGAALGSRLGFAAALLYLAEGAAGLPVFAHFTGGPHILAGPTAGYLFAFPVAAYITGRAADLGLTRRFSTAILPMTLATLAILAIGSISLALILNTNPLTVGILPFLPGAALKIALAAALAPKAIKIVQSLSR